MPIACKLCMIERGLQGSEIGSLPETEEEFYAHVEREHHIAVRRHDETDAQATERLQRLYPESANPLTCKCPKCKAERSEKNTAQSR